MLLLTFLKRSSALLSDLWDSLLEEVPFVCLCREGDTTC